MNNSTESLGKKTIKNAAWLYGQKIFIKLLSLLSIAVLARKLTPADFGLVSLSGVLMSFITLSTSATVGPYVIKNRDEGFEERDQAAFWLNLTFAAGIIIIYFCLIPIIANFYSEPLLKPILYVLSLRLFLAQLSVVPDSIVRKKLNYNQLVFRDTILNLVSAVISIFMALRGCAVWSLILPDLIISIPRFLIILQMSKWKPTLPFRTHLWKEILGFSKYVVGFTLLGGLINDGDTILLGKLVGSEQLGFYDRSWRTANLVSSNVVSVVGDISQPTFSVLVKTPERLKQAYGKTVRSLSLVSFPILIGMFVLADDLIRTLYGLKWESSILLLRIFIVFALQRSVFSTVGSIYNAMNRPDIGFKLNLIQLPFYFGAILIGNVYGIIGVTIGVTVVRTIFGFISMHLSCKTINLSTKKTLKSLLPSSLISIIMGIVLFTIKLFISQFISFSPTIDLLLYTFLGLIIYFILLITLFPNLLFEIIKIIDNFYSPLANILKQIFSRRLIGVQE